MLATHRTAVGLVIVVLGTIAAGRPAYTQNGSSGNSGLAATVSGDPGGTTGIFRQLRDNSRAPVGHRQPHPSDIPADGVLSPSDRALRLEDDRIDKKLIICRRC
jgi:hypothetical protein